MPIGLRRPKSPRKPRATSVKSKAKSSGSAAAATELTESDVDDDHEPAASASHPSTAAAAASVVPPAPASIVARTAGTISVAQANANGEAVDDEATDDEKPSPSVSSVIPRVIAKTKTAPRGRRTVSSVSVGAPAAAFPLIPPLTHLPVAPSAVSIDMELEATDEDQRADIAPPAKKRRQRASAIPGDA
jgi:hypothetical protein